MHTKLQIIYKHNKPYGIRDEGGYLFFFAKVSKWSGQEERYRREVEEQYALADYLLAALQERGQPTPVRADVLWNCAQCLEPHYEIIDKCAVCGHPRRSTS